MRKYIPPFCCVEQMFIPLQVLLVASTEDYEVEYIDPEFV